MPQPSWKPIFRCLSVSSRFQWRARGVKRFAALIFKGDGHFEIVLGVIDFAAMRLGDAAMGLDFVVVVSVGIIGAVRPVIV